MDRFMKAAIYHEFGGPLKIEDASYPQLPDDGIVLKVEATGLCLSDWHGWMGHDPDIRLPHVPGHEMAGYVVGTGRSVKNWKGGERVTLPFVCGCGHCPECISGNHQVCDHQFQPGFTVWGSFAEYVAVERADINLISLPDSIDFVTAASLGCRFVTSFRAIIDQGKVSGGQWVAVHGCGGVGLSAIMIAQAVGATVIAVDVSEDKLDFARRAGAAFTVNSSVVADTVSIIKDISGRGVHVSVDALGHPETCFNSVSCLRKRGRHVQVGLLLGVNSQPKIPMDKVIANELEICGSHGIQAFRYPDIFFMIETGKLRPDLIIGKTISLEEVVHELPAMNKFYGAGITVIDRF